MVFIVSPAEPGPLAGCKFDELKSTPAGGPARRTRTILEGQRVEG
jgi:hypothetical protein